MNTKKIILSILAMVALFNSTSCNKKNAPAPLAIETMQVSNLYAPQMLDVTQTPPVASGDFVRFSFSTGAITTSATEWDIAFRGTTILVNGGVPSGIAEEPARNGNAAAYIVNDILANVKNIDQALLKQDGTAGLAIPTGSGNGWYNYNPMINAIEPIAGKVIVFRTRNNRYAKMEILSYYKDAPSEITPEIADNDPRYYTFNYVYQPNEGMLIFE